MDSEGLARLAAEAADDRKAVDIRLLRVEDVTTLTDWFVVCSGLSDVQVRAIARSVEDRLEALRKSAGKARADMAQQQGSSRSVTSENVYG